jgi:GNAT superfamily N-acetyltransferase
VGDAPPPPDTRAAAFSIRSATARDVPLILEFINELADYERLAHIVVATHEGVERALFGERPAAEVLIAEADGAPAGFAFFFQNFSTFAGRPGLYLEDLFVRPAFRGRGCGTSLLARLAHIAVERRYGRMEWAVLDWNEMAKSVYRRIGAEPMADWTVNRLAGDALEKLARQDS